MSASRVMQAGETGVGFEVDTTIGSQKRPHTRSSEGGRKASLKPASAFALTVVITCVKRDRI